MSGPRLVAITDRSQIDEAAMLGRLDVLATRSPAIRHRAVVLLRDPELSGRAAYAWAKLLRERTAAIGASLWVADRLDIAVAVGADGVHLGGRSVAVADARALVGDRIVSVACHAVEEVVARAGEGADVALLSPIFETPGKGTPIGPEAIEGARRALSLQARAVEVIALGGVTPDRLAACVEAGADGVAAIRASLFGC